MDTNSKSKDCPECYGQGFAPWMRPIRPGAKLYPVPCETCGGYRTTPALLAHNERPNHVPKHLQSRSSEKEIAQP